jgi:Domain of unknown function (DUF5753)
MTTTPALPTELPDGDALFDSVPPYARDFLLDVLHHADTSFHFLPAGIAGWLQPKSFVETLREDVDPTDNPNPALTTELLVTQRLRLRDAMLRDTMTEINHVTTEDLLRQLPFAFPQAATRDLFDQLISVAAREPGVCDKRTSLRLLPQNSTLKTTGGDFSLVTFASRPTYCYIEHAAGGERKFETETLRRLRNRRDLLLDASLDEDQSLELLLELRAAAARLHGA